MKSLKLVLGALVVGLLVLFIPLILGTGPSANLGVGEKLSSGALFVPMLLTWVGGLLTALTPCVYPLIPITMSIFGAKKGVSRGQSIALTLTYILGIAVMFTSMGILAALSGQAFGSALGNPWVVGLLAVFFIAFGISMFGGWDFALPSGLQTKLSSVGKAGFLGAFLMGLVAGIVAAPCTGPVLSGILLHIATTKDVVLGGTSLFIYSLGLGFPFFLIGAFSLSLPKSGAWMDMVKSIFGIALFTLAFLYIRDAFPAFKSIATFEKVPYGALIASGIALLGVILGALHLSFHGNLTEKVLKGAGVVLVIGGLAMRPHAPIGAPAASAHELATWHSDEPTVVAAAKGANPVIIDFGAEWCAACKELEKITFVDPKFLAEADRWKLVRIDATNDEDEAINAIKAKYGVVGLPTVVLIDTAGEVQKDLTVTGFVDADDFVARMKKVQ